MVKRKTIWIYCFECEGYVQAFANCCPFHEGNNFVLDNAENHKLIRLAKKILRTQNSFVFEWIEKGYSVERTGFQVYSLLDVFLSLIDQEYSITPESPSADTIKSDVLRILNQIDTEILSDCEEKVETSEELFSGTITCGCRTTYSDSEDPLLWQKDNEENDIYYSKEDDCPVCNTAIQLRRD